MMSARDLEAALEALTEALYGRLERTIWAVVDNWCRHCPCSCAGYFSIACWQPCEDCPRRDGCDEAEVREQLGCDAFIYLYRDRITVNTPDYVQDHNWLLAMPVSAWRQNPKDTFKEAAMEIDTAGFIHTIAQMVMELC